MKELSVGLAVCTVSVHVLCVPPALIILSARRILLGLLMARDGLPSAAGREYLFFLSV